MKKELKKPQNYVPPYKIKKSLDPLKEFPELGSCKKETETKSTSISTSTSNSVWSKPT